MLIGALADATGVPTKTLRYWEGEGILREPAECEAAVICSAISPGVM